MEENRESSNNNYDQNKLPNHSNRWSNNNEIRKNSRVKFYGERNRQNKLNVPNDMNAYAQPGSISNGDATTFNKSNKYSHSQRMPSDFHRHNDINNINFYGNQRRNYGINTRGNYNHQDKSSYSNNFQRKPDYRNEYRGRYNNKKKLEKRNEPKESPNLNQRESLIWQLSHNKYECMICVTIIRSEAPTWSCDNCFHIFHVPCIEKWAKSGDNTVVRCPACQKQFDVESSETQQKFSVYRCFCGKLTNPVFKRGTIPHSCDEICGRSLASRSNFNPLYGRDVQWQDESTAVLGNSPGFDLELHLEDDEFVEECNESTNQEEDNRENFSVPVSQNADSSDLQASQLPCDIHSITRQMEGQFFECSEFSSDIEVIEPQAHMMSFVDKDNIPEFTLSITDNPEEPEVTSAYNENTTSQQSKEFPGAMMTLEPHELDKTSCSSAADWSCPHSCVLLCHPGPCPPCEALVTRACHCSRTRITAKCMTDARSLVCGSTCGRTLNCQIHRCNKMCHMGPCETCSVKKIERCWCDAQEIRETTCDVRQHQMSGDDTRFSCGGICDRALSCGEHRCSFPCHEGTCEPCKDVPKAKERCWCERVTVASLRSGHERTSCIDSRPDCGGLCGRALSRCSHTCASQCHPGPCPPCNVLVENVRCRCNLSVLPAMACWVATDIPDSLMCSKLCLKRLACGRHQCRQRCCIGFNSDQHECVLSCGRALSCKQHSCAHECGHPGRCPVCPNVSFEELSCHCGTEISLPPIACGQSPPVCSRDCTRPQPCDHSVRHHCHPDSELPCPPCTVLTSKQCPGQHQVYHNVPCFRPVATCGLPCGRSLVGCEHLCQRLCHSGQCQPDNADSDNSERCMQLCSRPRSGCGHPCGTPCHADDCSKYQTPCEVSMIDWCMCGLRSITSSCSGKSRINSDLHTVECDAACLSAAQLSTRMRTITLNSSYNIIQRHYVSFFEEFCKKNFTFVVSIENIFSNLCQAVSKGDCQDENIHKFQLISLEKAKFITKLCSRYLLKPTTIYNFKENVANVIVEAENNRSFVPKSILSKNVEDKHFKIFKPVF